MTQPTPRRPQDPVEPQEPFLIHLSRKAMAGEFEICLPVSIAGEATAAALEAWTSCKRSSGNCRSSSPRAIFPRSIARRPTRPWK